MQAVCERSTKTPGINLVEQKSDRTSNLMNGAVAKIEIVRTAAIDHTRKIIVAIEAIFERQRSKDRMKHPTGCAHLGFNFVRFSCEQVGRTPGKAQRPHTDQAHP